MAIVDSEDAIKELNNVAQLQEKNTTWPMQ